MKLYQKMLPAVMDMDCAVTRFAVKLLDPRINSTYLRTLAAKAPQHMPFTIQK